LAGAADHVPPRLDGISFVPTLLGEGSQADHDFLYWAFYERGAARAIRRGNWKGVQQPITQPIRLYDLSSDLGENHDVAAAHPEHVKQLAQLMDQAYQPSERWQFSSGSAQPRQADASRPAAPTTINSDD
jgi:arylsulfatase A